MSSCGCENLPEIFFLDDAPDGWVGRLQVGPSGNWKTLHQCPTCGQRFSVDAWDKYEPQVVVRIREPERWEAEADSAELRKTLLLKSRGGTEEGRCAWTECEKRRVRGVAYCLDHLWNVGARR